MSAGTLIFLLLVFGLPLAMMLMHRGGHAGGMGGCGMGHGGHGGHSGHADRGDDIPEPDERPVLGKPGERSQTQGGARHERQAGHGHC